MKSNKFTILITTYNRPNKIKRHLHNFQTEYWSKLKYCKPTIVIADDCPSIELKNLCKSYQKKLKYFKLIYLERKKKLGQGINLLYSVKNDISSGYVWPVGDDDILLSQNSVDFINKINKFSPNVAVCEFRQGRANLDGTFFHGNSRMVYDVKEGLESISRFGKLTSVVFKRPSDNLIKIVEKMFTGCMYEDRALAVFSYLCNDKPSLYLKTKLTAIGDSDYGLLRYSMRVFANLSAAMNLAIKYCSIVQKTNYPLIHEDTSYDEFKFWKMGLYVSLINYLKFDNYAIKYTKIRFFKELLIFPIVIYRKYFNPKNKLLIKWIR